MRENILNKLLAAFFLLTILSCHARKQLAAAPNTPVAAKPVKTIDAKLNLIRAQQVNFNTFSAKAKASLDINGNTNDCTLNIRISHDKKIWVSVTALLGIEIARAQITPDSILVINRLQGVYLKKPFSYIYAYANRQVNYAMLQALLTGNAAPALLNDSDKYADANNNITLNGNLDDLVYKLIFGTDMKITQTSLSNGAAGQSLQVNNGVFVQAGNQTVPSQIDISSVAKDKKIQVNLHYTKVDINQPQDYPFNIPGSYAPAE